MIRRRGKYYRLFSAGALALVCLAAPPCARPQKSAKVGTAGAKTPTAIQQAALTSLDAVAVELREVEDYSARVALSGDIVRLLAERAPERCRQLLDSLFEDVLKARQAQGGDSATDRRQDFDRIVRAVIKDAASFDGSLATAYTRRYAEIKRQEVAPTSKPGATPPAVADLYLRLATELVGEDPAMAAAVAGKALAAPVSAQTLVFLETLRKKDARLAADFLTSAAQGVAARGGTEINELFLLYSFVFSPRQVLSVVGGRLVLRQIPDYQRAARDRAEDDDLAGRFLPAAARIVLSPDRYAGGTEHLSSGVVGDLYFIEVIDPHVRARLPEMADALLARRGLLENRLELSQAAAVKETSGRWHAARSGAGNNGGAGQQSLDALLQRAADASDPDLKDRLLYTAATTAVGQKQYGAALDAAGKMSEKNRDAAKQFIGYSIAEAMIKDGATEEAEQWARRDDDAARRAYLLTLIADSLVQSPQRNVGRASEILSEVEQLAAKAGPAREGAAVLAGAAAVYARYDAGRSLALLGGAVRSANKVAGFNGETAVSRSLQVGDFSFTYEFYDGEFSFHRVVGRQGRDYFLQTLQEVQGLKERVPRLRAVIAACGSVLARADVTKRVPTAP